MIFARPEALWALLLALPIAAVHLYRRRRRRVEVPFAALLRETSGAAPAAGLWKRLLDGANLAARLLALACLALAAAGPRRAEAAADEGDLVVVLDGDVTTRAREGPGPGGSRFERQVALAKAHVLSRRSGRAAAVLARGAPRVLAAPTRDRAAVLRALEAAEPGDEAADLGAAVAAAREAAGGGRARVVVVTSRDVRGVREEAEGDLLVVGAGTASDDQGFVDQRAVPAADGVRWTLSLVVRDFAAEPRRRTVVLTGEGGRALGRADVDLPARGEAEARFEVLPRGAGETVVARLEGEDAFAGNDATAARLAAFARPSVLVVHAGDAPRPFVPAVLDAMGDLVDRERSGTVPAADAAKAAPRDVVVWDGVPPAAAPRAVAWVLLAPFGAASAWPATAPVKPGREVREPVVWRVDEGHPLLRGVDLSTAHVARATTLVGDLAGLAFAEGEPVVAEGERAGLRWIAFGLDPDGSDLPLRAALPVLVRNALRRLATAARAPFAPFSRAGEPLRPRLPLGGGPRHDVAFERAAGTAPGAPAAPPPVSVAGWGPEHAGVPGPPGGPWRAVASSGGVPAGETVVVDLDRARDVTPVRPAGTAPAAAPAPEDDPGPRWRAWLLAAAGALLVLDVALAALVARRLGRGPRPA